MSDVRLIFSVQAVRAFLYGFSSILIGSSLAASGLDATAVGAIFTAMLVGMAISSLAVGRWGERFGRRRTYVGLLLVMGVAGAVFALTGSLAVLVVAALTGTLSTDPNESGPITTVEQAMLASTPPRERSQVYGRYNAVAYLAGAVGALAAGGPSALRDFFPAIPPDQRWLLLMPVGAAVCAFFAMRLSRSVEVPAEVRPADRGLRRSRGMVQRLAALFSLDAFAGGFIVAELHRLLVRPPVRRRRRAHGPRLLRRRAAAGGVIGRGRLARRAHRPAEHDGLQPPALERAAGADPVRAHAGVGVRCSSGRSVLSQMDVPARQAYVAALVDPAERTAAAGYTNAARHVVRPCGPGARIGLDGDGGRDAVPRRRRPQGDLRRGAVLHVPPGAAAGRVGRPTLSRD